MEPLKIAITISSFDLDKMRRLDGPEDAQPVENLLFITKDAIEGGATHFGLEGSMESDGWESLPRLDLGFKIAFYNIQVESEEDRLKRKADFMERQRAALDLQKRNAEQREKDSIPILEQQLAELKAKYCS